MSESQGMDDEKKCIRALKLKARKVMHKRLKEMRSGKRLGLE
jgi:hypothetical protein